jgi:hypothetical protein
MGHLTATAATAQQAAETVRAARASVNRQIKKAFI